MLSFTESLETLFDYNKNRFKYPLPSSSSSHSFNSQRPSSTNDEPNIIWNSRRQIIDLDSSKPEKTLTSRVTSYPIYRALARHHFLAQTKKELSFKKGDIFFVLRRINADWLEGEFKGQRGIFPLNHVELFPIEINGEENPQQKNDLDEKGEAIVKYDFIPQKTFELQLRKGDKVILLRRLDENWYEGRLNHIEGIFPAAYVETLREPPDDVLAKPHQTERVQTSKQSSPGDDSLRRSKEKVNIIPDLTLPPTRKCQVLYDYSPQNPDELEIHVGDTINIIEMCDDGWYCGMMEKSDHPNRMVFGTFPGNYVRLLPN